MKTYVHSSRALVAAAAFIVAAAWGATVSPTLFAADSAPKSVQSKADREQKNDRTLSFVLLLRSPRQFDERALSDAVSKGLAVEFSQGGKTGITAKPPYYLVKLETGKFIISNMNDPYFENAEKLTKEISDPKLAAAVREGRGWIAIDWIQKKDTADYRTVYQQMGKIAAALAGPDTLAIYSPDTDGLSLYDAKLAETLRSDDPLRGFEPVPHDPAAVDLSADDPKLKAAETQARGQWPEFVTAFKEKRGDHFAVKGRIVEGDNIEFLWINVTEIDDKLVHGTPANYSSKVKKFQKGTDPNAKIDIHVRIEDVDDWMFIDPSGKKHGGFTQKVMEEASNAPEAKGNSSANR